MSKTFVDPKRVRELSRKDPFTGPVLYWMSRDQRADDNWALLYAQELALQRRQALLVVFCLVPEFLGATQRHYLFMLKGLHGTAQDLLKKNIPFILVSGKPEEQIPSIVRRYRAGTLVTDFDPLRVKAQWKKDISSHISIPLYEVDAHNIVPCWHASDHQEYGAYTIRPKIKRLLRGFMGEFPELRRHPYSIAEDIKPASWRTMAEGLRVNDRGNGRMSITSGRTAAHRVLREFLCRKGYHYAQERNDPNKDAQSGLSAYLHFGQISAQRVALSVKNSALPALAKAAFLEESIVRRELADNLCFYNHNYDSVEGFPEWAWKTLSAHKKDKRYYLYTFSQLENARTHDLLWNAAQRQMVVEGKIHGYLRMYWAKKILEWTPDVSEALRVAIELNDTYSLDGRDPNGYAGIAWSIGGVHDRAWNQRPIFGNIRYMSYNGCKSKFDVDAFIKRYR